MAQSGQPAGILDPEAFVEKVRALLPTLNAGGRRMSMIALAIDGASRRDGEPNATVADILIRRVGASLRDRDIFGLTEAGDFAILLPDCPPAAAARIAERIRTVVAAVPFETGLTGPAEITVSLGVTSPESGGTGVEVLMAAASAALDRARSGGSNRVFVLHEGSARTQALH